MDTAAPALARDLKWGPDGYKNIAIIGSAPTSVLLAPYDDPAWAIWGCSPGVYGQARRTEVWWEIHRWEPPVIGRPTDAANRGWFSPEYVQFIQQHKCVMMAGPDPDVDHPISTVPNGWRFPFEDFIAKYGSYFFTSSMAYMLAQAIELLAPRAKAGEAVAIGLWGVDMAAHDEYAYQRPACQHWIGLARQLGIQVILPPESDLMQPPAAYGIIEYNPRHQKMLANLNNLKHREQQLAGTVGQANNELIATRGAISQATYDLATWAHDPDPGCDITSAVSLAGVAASRPLPADAVGYQFNPTPAPGAPTPPYEVMPSSTSQHNHPPVPYRTWAELTPKEKRQSRDHERQRAKMFGSAYYNVDGTTKKKAPRRRK